MTETNNEKKTIGILAYGSLICDPKCEIEKHRKCTIKNVFTPFPVEFARQSGIKRKNGRGGAPTLVPVTDGGAIVKGQVFVMKLSECGAMDVLYRRVRDKVCTDITYNKLNPKEIRIKTLSEFAGLDTVLYTEIDVTIELDRRTPKFLAECAIASVQKAKPFHDGISYLIAAKECGIVTALSADYEKEILRQTECECLIQALKKLTEQREAQRSSP